MEVLILDKRKVKEILMSLRTKENEAQINNLLGKIDLLPVENLQSMINQIGDDEEYIRKYFEDKLEGKVVDVYLDLALEKLLKEGKINQAIYSSLTPKNLSAKELFTFNQDYQSTYGNLLEYDTYIACFCKEKNYRYMYDNYAGDDGYCIGFSQTGIKEIAEHSFGKGFTVQYHPIMYGEEVVEFFYKKILKLVSLIEKIADLQSTLKILRKRVQYSSKLYGYSNEKEERLIIKIAKGHTFQTKYPFTLGYNEERKRRFLELTLPKYCFWDIESQNPICEISDYLKKNNYRT